MSRRSDLLERISVTTPCAADWESMVGNDQIRFCAHCNLNVHNLSSMKRTDARRLVRRMGESLCVRYFRRPDNSLNIPSATPRLHRIARRASIVSAGTFGALLTLSAGALAQTGPQSSVDSRNTVERVVREGATLAGTISDPNGAVIINVEVTAVNTDTRESRSVYTNLEGVYRFDSLPPGTYALTAVAAGFNAEEVKDVELQKGIERTQDATLQVQGPQVQIEVTAEVSETASVMGGAMIALPKDPLVLAAYHDDLKALKELLVLGADANKIDEGTNTTALFEAVEHGDAEMVVALLDAGADVNLRDKSGRTALMTMTDDTSAETARTLLAAGAKVNLKDEDGDTALTQVAGRVKVGVLQALIEGGAKINARNNEGETALMAAAQEGLVENVRALIVAGADLNEKDKDGETALKYARDGEHEDVVGLLVAYGLVD